MKLVRSIFLTMAALAVVSIAVLSGCSGSDPLSTTVGSLVLDFQITDPGSTQYEEADMLLGTAIVRPVSQEGQDSLGDAGISLLSNELFEMDLNLGSNSLPAASLPAGSFLLEEINFFVSGFIPLRLLDQDLPDPMAACVDRMPAIPRPDPDPLTSTIDEQRLNAAINSIPDSRKTLHPNVIINIPSDGLATQQVQINSTMLIQAYKNAIICSENVTVCQVSRGGQVPCIGGFNANQFFDELESQDWITF